jgi:hypothetical protein
MGLGMKDILELIVWVIVVDFIISGVLIASAMFYLCNKVCRIKLRTIPSFFSIFSNPGDMAKNFFPLIFDIPWYK